MLIFWIISFHSWTIIEVNVIREKFDCANTQKIVHIRGIAEAVQSCRPVTNEQRAFIHELNRKCYKSQSTSKQKNPLECEKVKWINSLMEMLYSIEFQDDQDWREEVKTCLNCEFVTVFFQLEEKQFHSRFSSWACVCSKQVTW